MKSWSNITYPCNLHNNSHRWRRAWSQRMPAPHHTANIFIRNCCQYFQYRLLQQLYLWVMLFWTWVRHSCLGKCSFPVLKNENFNKWRWKLGWKWKLRWKWSFPALKERTIDLESSLQSLRGSCGRLVLGFGEVFFKYETTMMVRCAWKENNELEVDWGRNEENWRIELSAREIELRKVLDISETVQQWCSTNPHVIFVNFGTSPHYFAL